MYTLPWYLSDHYKQVKKHHKTVFSTFACGGGSTMGYKLAGFDVIGANDIDPEMKKIYVQNHAPKHYILGSIVDMKTIDLPEELYNLDILDGSPPCSTFSISGSRERAWGKNKKFREGQTEQVLSDLFFEFIAVAKRLQPKVIISENVKGLLLGNAKGYVVEIIKQLNDAGYDTQIFMLNAASMGLPQKRERVFFCSKRKDIDKPPLKLQFNEKQKTVLQACGDIQDTHGEPLSEKAIYVFDRIKWGENGEHAKGKGSWFSWIKINPNQPCSTITAHSGTLMHWKHKEKLSKEMITRLSTFPDDYNYMNLDAYYVCGMSVPPHMMAHVAGAVYNQWLE